MAEKNKQPYKLESILISHFCEKVRWCLEYCNIPFIEEFDSAIFGRLFFVRSVPLLFNYKFRVSIGNSSDILRYIYGCHVGTNDKVKKLLNPTKEALELEAMLDEKLGVSVQRLFYYNVSKNPKLKQVMLMGWGIQSKLLPFYQKILLKILFPVYVKFLVHGLELNKENYDKSVKYVKEIFKLIEDKLSDGRKYIMGDELSYIDITFASLSSHFICDGDTFANGLVKDVWVDFEKNDEIKKTDAYKIIMELRKSKSADFIRRIYKEHRPCNNA